MAGLPSLTGPGFGIGVKDVGRRRLLEKDELLTRNGVPQMLGEEGDEGVWSLPLGVCWPIVSGQLDC